jgi:hypothetical protein
MTRAVELQPQEVQFHYNLGKAFRDHNRMEEAAAEFRRTVQLHHAFAPAWNNLGNTLRDLDRLDEALACYETADQLRPNHPSTLRNMGLTHRDLLHIPEAIRCLDSALAHQECRMSHGMLLLLTGQFVRGWNDYEARFDIPAARAAPRRDYGARVWDGSDPRGRTILLHTEQGFGDAIQFARYAPPLAARGARVIVECRPELVGLFASLHGVEQILSTEDPLPRFDAHRSLMSMALLFGTTPHTVPAQVPYLHAHDAALRRWEKIIEPGGIRIGLAWAGAPSYGDDRNRSLTLQQLAPLAQAAPEGTRFYGLQKGPAAAQSLQPPPGMRLLDLREELTDFTDTAAAMQNLDLVISVDTAVGHLAGALGKPVWLMLPHVPDWRWMLHRSDTPWYPSMQLFRQPNRGDWNSVIEKIASDLAKFLPP